MGTATERQRQLVAEFLATLPDDEGAVFREIIDFLLGLGYAPVRCKTSGFGLDFARAKARQKIAKFYTGDFRLKFYASKEYSGKFSEGIRRVIEEFGGRYTGCYGCGRCHGNLRGYTYVYPDGREVFRCGSELIEVASITTDDIPEIRELIAVQDRFLAQTAT